MVLFNFILFRFVLGNKIIMRLTVSPGTIVDKKIWIFSDNFLELYKPAICIFKLFQNPAIFLIHYFQKNPGNNYTIKLYYFYENN